MTLTLHRSVAVPVVLVVLSLMLSACGSLGPMRSKGAADGQRPAPVVSVPPQTPAPSEPAPAKVSPPAVDQRARAQAALRLGLQAYRAGRYPQAETQLRLAVREGLDDREDLANAHKHLAFIYCTSQRQALCAEAFRSARRADPDFKLTRVEAGHPMWGAVYRRALRLK